MIHVAVIGAGHWGPNLIRNFQDPPTSEVAWVAERDERRLREVAIRFPHAKLTKDANDIFRDPSVGAVVVASPTITHYKLAKAALLAGKHVLVEKPITTSVDEAEELCVLASEHARVLMVGHVFLYNTAIRQIKTYMNSEDLGKIYYISTVRTNLGPIRTDVNAAWDLAAHDISIVNYWLDEQPVTASAIGGSWINTGVDDAIFATLRFPGRILVHLHASWLHPRKAREITVVGDHRMLTFDDMNISEPIRIHDKHVSEERTPPAYVDTFASFRSGIQEGDITIPKLTTGEPLRLQCDHFLDCINEGKPPVSDGWDGLAVVRALDAIARSVANAGTEEPVASRTKLESLAPLSSRHGAVTDGFRAASRHHAGPARATTSS